MRIGYAAPFILISLIAFVVCLVAARLRTVVLGVALLSAISAPVISGVLLTVVFPPRPGIHTPVEFVESALLMAFLALVPAGTFGFIAGLPGGLWWSRRGKFLPSRRRIAAEAAGIGLLLGLAFPFYFVWIIRWGSGFDRSLVVFSGFDGAMSATVVALVLAIKTRVQHESQNAG